MKKRLLSFVLAFVLVISMIPATTLAATTETRNLKLMANTDKELLLESVNGAPVYTKNVPATFTDEGGATFSGWAQEIVEVTNEATDEWHLKFYYDDDADRWTVLLKGAKLDAYNDDTKQAVTNSYAIVGAGSESYGYALRMVIAEDSYLEGKCMLMANGSNRWTSANILSENNATLYGKTTYYGIYVQRSVYLNCNLDCYGNTNSFIYTNNSDTTRTITVNGGNIKLDNYYQLSSAKTYSLKINGGNVILTNATAFATYKTLTIKDGLCGQFKDLEGNPTTIDKLVNGSIQFVTNTEHVVADCVAGGPCTICGTTVEPKAAHEAEADDNNCMTAVTCKYCDVVMTEGRDDHEPGDPSGDCTVAVTCKNCNFITTPAKDHTPKDAVIENDTDKSYDSVIYCAECDKEISREVLSKLCPHTNNTFLSQVDATCTEPGVAYYYCNDCEENYEVVLTASGHNHVAGTPVAPTISTQGYTPYVCDKCGDTYNSDFQDVVWAAASIGEQGYNSLKEAVEAAEDGDVILLRKNIKEGDALYIDKNITINFNGGYYSVSSAYQGAAIVIAPGAEVTLWNGNPSSSSKLMITYSTASVLCCKNFNYLIRNNGTLHVKNLTLNGNNAFGNGDTYTIENSGIVNLNEGTVVQARVSSINNITGTITKAKNVEVTAPNGYHFSSKTGVLEKHDYLETLDEATVYDVAYLRYTCECGDFYRIPLTGSTKLPVIAINVSTGRLYATVQDAVNEAQNGQTIEMVGNVQNGKALVIPENKKITIDMKGLYYATKVASDGAAMVIEEGADLTLISTGANSMVKVEYVTYWMFDSVIKSNGTLTLENVTVNGNNLFNDGSRAIVNNGAVTLKDDVKINIRQNDPKVDVFGGEGEITDLTMVNAPLADLTQMEKVAVKKTASAGGAITAHPGGRLHYTITITNNNDTAISVNVTDYLPSNVAFISGCDDVRDESLYWSVKNIAPGETRTITYTVKPDYTVKEVRASKTDILIKNREAKVIDTVVPAPAEDIWVLETFNATDRYRMEMAIDALVTANLTQYDGYDVQMNGIGLASQMYWVGFSTTAGFGTPDLNELLTIIYEKAGEDSSGGTSGGGEEDAIAATNLLDRVVPTLYGGTQIPAEKDKLFRGQRATEVTIDDLISGDLIIVSDNGAEKLYIVDGEELVELGKTYVTRKIDPATVLSGLPTSDKYAVLRCSINLATSFSLESDEIYNEYDKQEMTDLQKALVETAKAYLLRGDSVQYDDGFMGKTGRFESLVKNPEDYTVDQYGYLDCAHFTYDVNWATYGVAVAARTYENKKVDLTTCLNMMDSAKRGYDPATFTGTNKSTIFYYEPTGVETDAEKQAIYEEFISRLQPGDQIVYRYPEEEGGHAMLYIGNGLIIHCAANKFNTDSKRDSHDAGIRFLCVDDLFNQEMNARRYMFDKTRFGIVRLYNEVENPTITENTQNRIANMQGVVAEKIVSTAMGKTVNPGDEITYTFYIFNTNKTAKQFAIRDELSQYVTFVSATDGGACSGNNISWDITVPADTRISVSYTVKVNEGVATYTAIDGSKATINGVLHKCIDTHVAPTLTTEQQQAIVDAVYAVKEMDTSSMNGVQILNQIYKTAFGVDNIFGEGVTTDDELVGNFDDGGKDNVGVFNNTRYWSDVAYVSLMDANTSKPAMMVAPGMFGGNYVYNSNQSGETFTRFLNVGDKVLRSRYFWEKDMVVGDVFFMRGKTTMYLYIYVGNDTLVSVGAGTKFAEVGAEERLHYTPATGTWRYYAVLRPSMVNDLTPTPDVPGDDTPVVPTVNGNINASVGTTVNAGDLSFYKTSTHVASATVTPGKQVAYSIVVTNNGSESKTVTVTDEIPEVAEFEAGCQQISGNQMSWEITLEPGQCKSIIYTLKAKNDEANLGMALTSAAKVDGTAVPFHDIYVERTLGNVDQGLMETAIDAFRQYTDLKGMNLLKMIWNVAISKSVSYNDAEGNTMTAADLLKLVFTGEGSTGDSEGSGEEAATAAVDFTKAVIPTIYGGTGATAEQMARFNGLQASVVTTDALMSGDAIFVQESESDTDGKIYIYNGKRLFLVADGVIDVNTQQVLNNLSNAYRYAGFRFSFVIANRKDFSEDRKDTFTEEQKAVISIAEALLLRGDRAQYDAGSTMNPEDRYEYGTNTPEDFTSDSWKYTNCAILTYDSYYYGLGLNTGSNWYTSAIINSAKKQNIYYYEPTGSETDAEKQAQIDAFYAALQPADTIVIRRANSSGHAMLYIGDGKVIHSTGGSYKVASDTQPTGVEQFEATVRYLNAYDYFDPKCDNGGAYSYFVFGGAVTQIGIYRPLKSFSGSIPQETVNRMNNLQGIAVEKVASKAFGQTVNVGEELTYTIKLLNANDEAKTLEITDVIPAGTSFVSANGATVDGSNLAWTVTIPGGEKAEVSFTVKVGNDVPGGKIESKSAVVGGVSVRSSDLFVANTLTEAQQQAIIDAVASLSSSTLTNLELANEIYKIALGVENVFTYTELKTLHSQMYEKKEGDSKYSFIDNEHSAMVAPGLYGGRNFKCEDSGKYGRLTRLPREDNLIVGDILFGRTSSSNGVYIYLGNGICWSLSTNKADTLDINDRMERAYGYKNYWAIFRPSMVLENN